MKNFGIKYNGEIIRVFRYKETALRYMLRANEYFTIVPTDEEPTNFGADSPYYEGDKANEDKSVA